MYHALNNFKKKSTYTLAKTHKSMPMQRETVKTSEQTSGKKGKKKDNHTYASP